MPNIKVVVDSREPKKIADLIYQVVGEKYSAPREPLQWGDVSIGSGWVLIERKTVNDLLNTLSETREDGRNRLWAQIDGIAKSSPNPILLVEGQWSVSPRGRIVIGRRTTGWAVTSMQRTIHEVQERYKVKFLWTPNHQGTALTVKALLDWSAKLEGQEEVNMKIPHSWDGIGIGALAPD